jgi:hypothetical protein
VVESDGEDSGEREEKGIKIIMPRSIRLSPTAALEQHMQEE